MSETKPILRKVLSDGSIVELWPMLFNVRLTITSPQNDGFAYDDGWCFNKLTDGVVAFGNYDGEGEPKGWNKHPMSGRWRKDGTEASEVNNR